MSTVTWFFTRKIFIKAFFLTSENPFSFGSRETSPVPSINFSILMVLVFDIYFLFHRFLSALFTITKFVIPSINDIFPFILWIFNVNTDRTVDFGSLKPPGSSDVASSSSKFTSSKVQKTHHVWDEKLKLIMIDISTYKSVAYWKKISDLCIQD